MILLFINSYGQSNNIEFDHYTTNDGLSNGYINAILQDSKGFIWIGTANGLNRFDGISFKTYYFDLNDSTSIPGSSVTSLVEDSLNNIWVMTSNGLCIYDRKTDLFSRKAIRVNGEKLNDSFLYSCIIDSKGFLWVSQANNGIFRFKIYNNPQISKCIVDAERYFLEDIDVDEIHRNNVFSFIEDSDSKIWIASFSNKIMYFDNQRNEFITQPIDHPEAHNFSNKRKGLIIGSNGDFYLSIEDNGLLVWDRKNNNFRLYKPNGTDTGPKGNVLSALAEDKNGLIWIGDRNSDGISIFNKKTKKFTFCQSEQLDPYSLNTNKINCIYRDKTGLVWVGATIGVNKYSTGKFKFNRYFSNPDLPDKLSFNNTLCFTESKNGDIWIGTDGGGLNKLDRKTGKFSHFVNNPSNRNSLSSNAIISVFEDHEGTLWMGTFHGGLARMKDNKFDAFYPDRANPYSISDKNVWYVFEDSKQNLWAATLSSGLELFDRKTNRFYHYSAKEGDSTSLCNNTISEIYEDSKQNLYFTSNQGVSILDLNAYDFSGTPPDLKFRSLHHVVNKNSLSSNDVYCVKEDNKGNLWFGTFGSGIDKLDRSTGKFTNYSIKDGLPGNSVTSILVDSLNDLWLATDKGLAKFNPISNEFIVFDRKDGLQNRSLKSWAIKTKDGEMFFGGPDGFNSFYPDRIKYAQNQNIPPVVITGLKIFNKPVKINEQFNNRIILAGDISEIHELVLSYAENYFTFEFVALDYITPEKNNYAYMMEGFDKDWIQCGTKHEANYTNLDPGKYTFRVKASNNDGVWNEAGTSIKVVILPPWWSTWWFRLFAGFGVIAVVVYVYYSRIQQYEKQKILLEKMVAEKTSELHDLNATKDKFFSIIAHDIKNPFNAILGFTELLEENYKEWTDEMKLEIISLVNTSSKNLYQLLEDLLQWSRSQRGIIEFKPEKIELKETFQRIIDLMKGTAEAKNIELDFTIPENGLAVHADRQMLDTIMRNLISNALKFTNTGGKVHVIAEMMNGLVNIKVTDNGVGMRSDIKDKLFKIDSNQTTPGTANEIGSGLGLILVKEFVTRHGGEIGVDSVVGEGSTFHFTLPVAI